MKIFLTGGTGFIGSQFIRQALALGHEVVAQRRPGSQPRITLPLEPQWVDRPLDGDFSRELKGSDVVVHLAAHTPNPPYASLSDCLYWNAVASVKLIEQAAQAGVNDIVVAGTYFEYGSATQGQVRVHPNTQMHPTQAYPISKAAATIALTGLARLLGLRLQILRIFQVYGEGEASTRFWPSLKAAALEGRDFPMSAGTQVRDFIEVGEVANKFIAALHFKDVRPGHAQIRNIGTGHGQSLIEFAQYWWRHWGAQGRLLSGQIPMRPGEPESIIANIEDIYEV